MKAFFGHVGINVSNPKKSFPFWKDMVTFLGYMIVDESAGHMGVAEGSKEKLCLTVTARKYRGAGYHRKQTGMTHLAFSVRSKKEVDEFTDKFLKPHKIRRLYDSPKAFPEYASRYYAVFFEDPDRIKIEVYCE